MSEYETIDLTNCDREPIHIPGSIQPHGALLALDTTLQTVLRHSANAPAMLGLDGDPVDVLVLLDYPLFPEVGVSVRPVGVFNMTDDGGSDAKVISVPAGDPRCAHIQYVTDIPEYTRKEIEHFFEH